MTSIESDTSVWQKVERDKRGNGIYRIPSYILVSQFHCYPTVWKPFGIQIPVTTVLCAFAYWSKHLIGAITFCYNNIGNLLPSRDKTILVKIWQQIISKTLRRHVSAINSHHQAKLEQHSGTRVVCTVWDPISFTIVVH